MRIGHACRVYLGYLILPRSLPEARTGNTGTRAGKPLVSTLKSVRLNPVRQGLIATRPTGDRACESASRAHMACRGSLGSLPSWSLSCQAFSNAATPSWCSHLVPARKRYLHKWLSLPLRGTRRSQTCAWRPGLFRYSGGIERDGICCIASRVISRVFSRYFLPGFWAGRP